MRLYTMLTKSLIDDMMGKLCEAFAGHKWHPGH
jgi:hypothetical protein